jgi:fermentation-respiration switch protein FrsA (DUF1100 family)
MSGVSGLVKLIVPLAFLAGTFLLVAALGFLFQRSLIYFPDTAKLPGASLFHPHAREVSFGTEDGLRLEAWLVPPEGPASGSAVLVFHGNAGDRSSRLPLAEALAAEGHAVLLTDYRGYAGNPGRPSEEGLRADARAARAWLIEEGGFPPDRLVYFGGSLGAGVAVALAAEHPPAALILRSPFTSLPDVAAHHYPFLPVRLLLRDRYPSLASIRKVSAPLLVIAGGADHIVPPEQSRRLFEAAPGPKRLLEIPGAGHNDYVLLAGEEMIAAIAAFLAEPPGSAPDPAGS